LHYGTSLNDRLFYNSRIASVIETSCEKPHKEPYQALSSEKKHTEQQKIIALKIVHKICEM